MPQTATQADRPSLWKLARWGNTVDVKDRMEARDGFEEPDAEAPNGSWKGRHIIGRDTPIHGGVYLGSGAREAIVVDECYGLLPQAYDELVHRRDRAGVAWNAGVVKEVYDLTCHLLPFCHDTVDAVARMYDLGRSDRKVYLDHYVEEGGGVCRHQACLAGYLFEKAIREGRLRGQISVDRNTIAGRGGHAWARYTNSGGTVFIIDAAQHYCGRLDAIEDGDFGRWFYLRPEEMDQR